MSQPQLSLPRTFKFVGGPSRKRRRHVPPVGRDSIPRSSRPIFSVAASTAQDNVEGSMQPIFNVHPESATNNSPENDESNVVPGGTVCGHDDAVATAAITADNCFADEPQNMPDTEGFPPIDIFESLLDWPASNGMTMASDTLGSALAFNDPFPLFGAPFHLSTLPSLNLLGDPGPSASEDIMSEVSISSPEDFENEVGPEPSVPRSIPGSVTDNVYRLFAQYDREFCVWPLTHDFEANPFRYDLETGRDSPLLWHCIMALSYKHIHRETGTHLAEAKLHKTKAVQLFRELEGDLGSAKSRANLLNGLLILMTLDCATSAQGPWVAHLSRAQKIIEALDVFRIQKTPKIQAQLDMLVWWDVTLSLTTRRGTVLSGPVINSVSNSNIASTFYNISGCPEELFTHMFQLGTYAREFELASHMTCVTFDMGPVLAVEKAIKEWRAPQYDEPDVDLSQMSATNLPGDWGLDPAEAVHYIQDLYHCAQAWRFALLVYIERVFKWRRHEASMTRMGFFARKALSNVLSCRRSVMIQKQLLLPVFLAACETDDEYLREHAREYCRWWGVKTRYDMFITTLGLLEEVWAAAADPGSWWGSLIDQKSKIGSTKQYLFG